MNGASFDVSVDGGAKTNPTVSGNVLTIALGETDAFHVVHLGLHTGWVGAAFTQPIPMTITAVGTPTLSGDPDWGPQLLSMSGDKRIYTNTFHYFNTPGFGRAPEFGGTGYNRITPDAASGFKGLVSRLYGRADRVYVHAGTWNVWFALERDGVRVASVRSTDISDNYFEWIQIASGLDDGSEHEWTVIACGDGTSGTQFLDGVMLGGVNASVSTTQFPSKRPTLFFIGDSLTMTANANAPAGGADDPQGDASLGFPYQIARGTDRDVIVAGRSGMGTEAGKRQIAHDLMMASKTGNQPELATIFLGRNDTIYADALANTTEMINAVLGSPYFSGDLIVWTVPEVGGYAATGAIVNPAIRDAVTAVGSSRVHLFDAGLYNDITVGNDGTHYTKAGNTTLSTRALASGLYDPLVAGYANISDVRSGIDRGDGVNGTLVVPGASYVLSSQTFDNGTQGTLTLPVESQVLNGVTYGVGGNGSTGSHTEAPEPTYASAANVRSGVDRGDGTPGTLVVPGAANVLESIVFDNGTTGTAKLPSADKVLVSTVYGAGGNSLTGTLEPGSGETYPTASDIAVAVKNELESIPIALDSEPSNFFQMLIWGFLRQYRPKLNKSTGKLSVVNMQGVTVTTQSTTDNSSERSVGGFD
jgi:hypothetical protein